MGAKECLWRDFPYHEKTDASPKIMTDDAAGMRFTRVYDIKGYPADRVFGFIQSLTGFIKYKGVNDEEDDGPGEYERQSPHRVIVFPGPSDSSMVNPKSQIWRPWADVPLVEGFRWAYCTGIDSVEFVGAREQVEFTDKGGEEHDLETMYWPTSDLVRITATYQCLPYEIRDDGYLDPNVGELSRYVVRKCQPAAQYVELPGGYLRYEKTPTEANTANFTAELVNVGLGFPIGLHDLSYTWVGVLFPPKSADYILGRVNAPVAPGSYSKKPWDLHTDPDDRLDLFDGRYPPGTLLLLSYSYDERVSAAGQVVFDVTYKMRFNPKGHNYIYRTNLGKSPADDALPRWNRVTSSGVPYTNWSEPYTDTTHRQSYKTRPLFLSANFNDLFKPYLFKYPEADTSFNPAWDYY